MIVIAVGLGVLAYHFYNKSKNTQSELDKRYLEWKKVDADRINVINSLSEDTDSLKGKVDSLYAVLDARKAKIATISSQVTSTPIDTIKRVINAYTSENGDVCLTEEDARILYEDKLYRINMIEGYAVMDELVLKQASIIERQDQIIRELRNQNQETKKLLEDVRETMSGDIKRERRLKNVFMGATPVAFVAGLLIVL